MWGRGTAARLLPIPKHTPNRFTFGCRFSILSMYTFLSRSWKLSRRLRLGLLASSLLLPEGTWAHGMEASFRAIPTFQIEARYDSGEPMGGAQVTVFAPTDPTTPWQEGQTDKAGQFLLQPDPELPGLWQVRIRQAGHGVLLNVPVGSEAESTSAAGVAAGSHNSSLGLLQRGFMAACVIWGCLGTALFFSRPHLHAKASQPEELTTPALEQD